eukprot:CAMPEP_0203819270 /NCGR_PEP_ID=MMETSP0115-20131106/34843_1 /ASSEMBLY_ACC=CAM_ASM_000227 /TAXON_ID=33651 /ORGANISM="Bicosoecid sp, Strain ms1" /LENGTH=676 /DNA_ID=CAMNT_0050728249 /DNA_START=174 /DNA_END=2201 /DNA_ORIENTATION=+
MGEGWSADAAANDRREQYPPYGWYADPRWPKKSIQKWLIQNEVRKNEPDEKRRERRPVKAIPPNWSGRQFTEEDLPLFMDAVAGTTILQRVFLDGCTIDDDMCSTITTALQGHGTIHTLGLAMNRITDVGAASCATLIRNTPNLQVLNLSRNQIGDAGAESLAGALSTNETLRSLMLDGNPLTEEGEMALILAISTNDRTAVTFLSGINLADYLEQLRLAEYAKELKDRSAGVVLMYMHAAHGTLEGTPLEAYMDNERKLQRRIRRQERLQAAKQRYRYNKTLLRHAQHTVYRNRRYMERARARAAALAALGSDESTPAESEASILSSSDDVSTGSDFEPPSNTDSSDWDRGEYAPPDDMLPDDAEARFFSDEGGRGGDGSDAGSGSFDDAGDGEGDDGASGSGSGDGPASKSPSGSLSGSDAAAVDLAEKLAAAEELLPGEIDDDDVEGPGSCDGYWYDGGVGPVPMVGMLSSLIEFAESSRMVADESGEAAALAAIAESAASLESLDEEAADMDELERARDKRLGFDKMRKTMRATAAARELADRKARMAAVVATERAIAAEANREKLRRAHTAGVMAMRMAAARTRIEEEKPVEEEVDADAEAERLRERRKRRAQMARARTAGMSAMRLAAVAARSPTAGGGDEADGEGGGDDADDDVIGGALLSDGEGDESK